MNKTIYDKIDKNLISMMPKETFPGRIFTITTKADADKAVAYLMEEPLLGIDTETRPSFRKHVVNKVALLQVSTHDTCFLFRLNHIDMPESLIQLLESQSVVKVGLSLKDDLQTLERRHRFTPGKYIELQEEVKQVGIKDCSLQKVYANLFGKMISKRQRLSNWEADILTDAQKAYASIDAWACIRIHEEIIRLKTSHNYELIENDEAEQPSDNNIQQTIEYEQNIS